MEKRRPVLAWRVVLSAAAAVLAVVGLSSAQSPSFTTITGTTGPGALYEIAMPTGPWNGELVVYCHGIVPPNDPAALPAQAIAPLRETLTAQGFALVYSSYSQNGYAVKDGMQRTHQLRGIFASRVGQPTRTYLVGTSLGGLIAVMLAEQFPGEYDGVLSAGGLLGGGTAETAYMADARVLFDYFFPGLIPGEGFYVPPGAVFDAAAVIAALMEGFQPPDYRTLQLAATAKLPGITPTEIVTAGTYVAGFLMTYANNMMDLTNGHMPYDNTATVYSGSADDSALNAGVDRFAADPSAANYLARYYTPTGDLHVPVVALHATRDPLAPIFHEARYAQAVQNAGASQYLLQRTVNRFGHLSFTNDEMAAAFSALVQWVHTGVRPQS